MPERPFIQYTFEQLADKFTEMKDKEDKSGLRRLLEELTHRKQKNRIISLSNNIEAAIKKIEENEMRRLSVGLNTTSDRPYIQFYFYDLENKYEEIRGDKDELKLLLAELKLRRQKQRTRTLIEKVEASILAIERTQADKHFYDCLEIIKRKIRQNSSIALTLNEQDEQNVDLSSANPVALYPWQKRALDSWTKKGYIGVIEAVTGAGKTHVAMAAMIDHILNGWKVVIVVPSVSLQDQWYKKIHDLIQELPNEYVIARMGGGQSLPAQRPDVLVAVINSAARYRLLTEGNKGLIIADECHRYGAQQWAQALEQGFERRMGLTATFEREDDGIEKYLRPYFGEVCYSLGYSEALREQVIANFSIAFIGVSFNHQEEAEYKGHDETCKKMRSKLIEKYHVSETPYGEFIKDVIRLSQGGNSDGEATICARRYMTSFSKRRQVIANAANKIACLKTLIPCVQTAERTILFSQTKAAAEDAVKLLLDGGLNAKVLSSDMTMQERKCVFADFEEGVEDVVAAPLLLDEGVDVPAADLAIILASSRSNRQMIQRMGRVLRKKPDERLARVAIIYVKGTVEDPEMGAHEAFVDVISQSATRQQLFDAKEIPSIRNFLNTMKL